jgi:hypothetical protein
MADIVRHILYSAQALTMLVVNLCKHMSDAAVAKRELTQYRRVVSDPLERMGD